MQQLDTLKISIPGEAVRAVNQDFWIETNKTDCLTGQTETMKQAKSAALPVGVSSLTYREGGDFQLTYSAKVLKDDYLQGITANNWQLGLESVAEILDADPYQVYEKSIVYRCDSTNNISLDEIGCKPSQVYPALLAGRANQRFKDVYYNTLKKQGVEFRGVQQEKNRMIVYAKHLDLLKPTNKTFLQSLGNPSRMIYDAEKQIRFEVNHTAFRSIKQRFGIEKNTLKDVLNSKAPVNHNFLKKVLNVTDVKQTTLFDEYENFQGQGMDFIMLKGIQSIIQQLDYSDVMVKAFFQQLFPNQNNFKHHWYKKENSIKKIMESMQQQKFGVSGEVVNTICNKILISLLESVAA